jgi:hypothetical protein
LTQAEESESDDSGAGAALSAGEKRQRVQERVESGDMTRHHGRKKAKEGGQKGEVREDKIKNGKGKWSWSSGTRKGTGENKSDWPSKHHVLRDASVGMTQLHSSSSGNKGQPNDGSKGKSKGKFKARP